MDNYKIANMTELDLFINSAIQKGQSLTAIKGEPPSGATYSDGDLIVRPINVAWVNNDTSEKMVIVYERKEAEDD